MTVRTVFEFPDGVETRLGAGLPQSVEPFFDVAADDPDSDYDVPVGGNPVIVRTMPPVHVTAPILPVRTVKAHVVKYTAYRTFVGKS